MMSTDMHWRSAGQKQPKVNTFIVSSLPLRPSNLCTEEAVALALCIMVCLEKFEELVGRDRLKAEKTLRDLPLIDRFILLF